MIDVWVKRDGDAGQDDLFIQQTLVFQNYFISTSSNIDRSVTLHSPICLCLSAYLSVYIYTHIYIYIYIYIYMCVCVCVCVCANVCVCVCAYVSEHTYMCIYVNLSKIKLVIYYNKFKTSNLVIRNNSSPSIEVLQKTNVIYKFKCPLGDRISDNNNIYVGLTSTTLSRRLTMHLSDTSSIAQHLKKHSCPTAQLRKILTDNTTILEHQNNKQKLQILEALHSAANT